MPESETTVDPVPLPRSPEPPRIPHLSLLAVGGLFLRLGCLGFGGPAAHIALMHEEFVKRRAWISPQEFMDLQGATNLIPGPSSTEMALHLGHRCRGLPGMIVAGLCFIAPAAILVLGLAMTYKTHPQNPHLTGCLAGLKPVTLALILVALIRLAPVAVPNPSLVLIAIGALVLRTLGITEIPLFVLGAILVVVLHRLSTPGQKLDSPPPIGTIAWTFAGLAASARQTWASARPSGSAFAMAAGTLSVATPSLWVLFLVFLKLGSVIYGSGYVLLPFLETELVDRRGWLTSSQVLDSVSVAQLTPGPLFTGATFAGYLIAGLPGATLATLGIFLPGFILVALTAHHIHRLRQNTTLGHALDGVNAASLGLMAATLLMLGRETLTGFAPGILALASIPALLSGKVHPVGLLLFGGIAGWLLPQAFLPHPI